MGRLTRNQGVQVQQQTGRARNIGKASRDLTGFRSKICEGRPAKSSVERTYEPKKETIHFIIPLFSLFPSAASVSLPTADLRALLLPGTRILGPGFWYGWRARPGGLGCQFWGTHTCGPRCQGWPSGTFPA